ncbi:hypothetical protein LWI29_001661 [Acer saccharum]|uniref:Uncharacterized protein n=1 Tax=Acer saccharum TaxID=4024 RepID=A0AA39SB13_ACESA|nr:hypothetical protein LWI29_001661 [Acer saccharum]
MDLIHKLMNILLPPITSIALLFVWPLYLVFKFLSFIKRHLFSENVAGKVVIVTGAASGIGEQMAYEYAKRAAILVLVDIREDRLEAVVDSARRFGSPNAIAVAADVSVEEDCKRFVDAAVNKFGKVDHLVNNAGIARECSFKNVDSISKHTPIMASKAALISFFETLRLEMGGAIGITIVTPGLIKSEMSLSASPLKGIPMESKEECAKAIVRSGCRGDKYLVEPSWFRILFPWKAFCPELTEYCHRRFALMSRRHVIANSNLTQSTYHKTE